MHLVPFLKSQLTPSVNRVDAVWDVYPEMAAHPSQRETGRNILVTPRTRKSSSCYAARNSQKPHWMAFSLLQLSLKLFCPTIHQPRYLICNPATTQKQTHASFSILHMQGHERAYVRTVDIDVVVLAIDFFDQLRNFTFVMNKVRGPWRWDADP